MTKREIEKIIWKVMETPQKINKGIDVFIRELALAIHTAYERKRAKNERGER